MNQRLFSFYALCFACILYSCKDYTAGKRTFLNTSYIDSTVKPGDNFYLFANGKWLKNTAIPATESYTGSFFDLYNKSKSSLKSIVEELSNSEQKAGTIEQKIGDFYASGMDSVTIEKLGYNPVKPYLQEIENIKDVAGIMAFTAAQQKEYTGMLFEQSVGADEKNSHTNIAIYYQGGLGLPDRDYYFKTDTTTQKNVTAYKIYIQTLLLLTGDDSVTALKKTNAVYNLEKQLAEHHITKIALRHPQNNYHKMSVSRLQDQMPAFAWTTTLKSMGVNIDSVNVAQPEYFTRLNELLTSVSLNDWKAYLQAHLLQEISFALSSPFVEARFNFWGRAMYGQQQMKPRWQRIVSTTDTNLGDALGQIYVKKFFTGRAKKQVLNLVDNLQKAFEARINRLDWMSSDSKEKAKEKLHAFIKKIGYPDNWKDYSKVAIDRKSYFNNLVTCAKNLYQIEVDKLGKPVNKKEWLMTPAMVNAYYNPTFNEIVFPAGILQPPFFNQYADDAINYGGIGMVIGHEMTHAFDDEGSQYDKDGNLKNWWAKQDSVKFAAKSQQVISEYKRFLIMDSVPINGALTNGENIADIGALGIAYDAFKLTKEGKDTGRIDGFTPEQRFFLSYAQSWRIKMKDEFVRQMANTDPHSPAMYRVNIPLMNFTPFYDAFHLQPGDKMYKPEDARLKIW